MRPDEPARLRACFALPHLRNVGTDAHSAQRMNLPCWNAAGNGWSAHEKIPSGRSVGTLGTENIDFSRNLWGEQVHSGNRLQGVAAASMTAVSSSSLLNILNVLYNYSTAACQKGLNKLVNGDEIPRRVLPLQFLLWKWIFHRKIVPYHPHTLLDTFENSRGFDPFFVFCAHRFRGQGISLAKYSVSGAEQRRAGRLDFGFFKKMRRSSL